MPQVQYNAIINSNSDSVWSVLKRFGAISDWHPAIPSSEIEGDGPDGVVGCIRRLVLADGAMLREQLLMMDERQQSFSYRFLEAPLAVDNYVAHVKIIPLHGQEKSVVQWTASFENQQQDPHGMQTEAIRSLIVGGHESLAAFLSDHGEAAPIRAMRADTLERQ
jgi:hypothetical protein